MVEGEWLTRMGVVSAASAGHTFFFLGCWPLPVGAAFRLPFSPIFVDVLCCVWPKLVSAGEVQALL